MSCHSTPGNRAVLSVARHAAGIQTPQGRPVAEGLAQSCFHRLLGEGRELGLPVPPPGDVERFFDRQAFDAALQLPRGRSRERAMANLSQAWDSYCQDPSALDGATFHAWRNTGSLTAYSATRQDRPDPLTIAIDLDGCLYDFNHLFREWLVARGRDREALPSPQVYSLNDAWGIPPDEFGHEMGLALDAGILFRVGGAFRDATEGVRALGAAGHRIVVNSARALPGREREAKAATLQWLRENHVHPDGAHLANPRLPEDKMAVAFDVLVDDHPENVRAALSIGRRAFLLDRPWNRVYEDLPRATYQQIVEQFAPSAAP